ncbi:MULTISPECIES: dTDP-glucose 4,6-dehydratase [Streptomyces diastaticus group]|uniref:dTDP-glucose 4,6-dehydratase n=1 Tax=Streptomyces gougerotii TaxID=53448 RepID=A0A6A0CR25_9ACTN|nr:dTDP-glucose 4,6-dehydratase [Streptomyces gougerotii]GFH75928.1 dTDP-glucose 4,6-dehydratase [Streptomyces gougerotii]GFH79673.1 dTDP-glucose 4,6-dehydratase [Streptomyces gougerotii]GGU51998.1 dTDP-glucose 4,6-dehydratase [Streptomyces gougerotii]
MRGRTPALLVTGGAGFIGSHFVRSLLAGAYPRWAGASVTVLDKLGYCGNLENLAPVAGHPGFRFVRGEVEDTVLLDQVVPGHDHVVHFAAESHVDRSIDGAGPFAVTNVLGTQRMLDAALRHGVRRFLQVSTDEVYGSTDEGAWTEEQPLAPRSPYAATKAAADLLALAWHTTYGLDVVVTRCSNNFGPYQYPEKMVPRFVTNLLRDRRVPLYGDGSHVRDWVHVDDHCRGVASALERGRAGQVYHLGGGCELSNRELTGRILRACGAGWEMVENVADRRGHDRRYALDISKSTAELGYAPRVGFDEGLLQTLTWYRANRSWWERLVGD